MGYKDFKCAILSTIREIVGMNPLAEYQALGSGSLPVLLIWGEGDQTVPAADIDLVR